jgi:hypothetical protein
MPQIATGEPLFTASLRSFPIGDSAHADSPNPPEGGYVPLQSDTRNALFHQMLGRRGILGWRQWRALNLQQSSVSCVLKITD